MLVVTTEQLAAVAIREEEPRAKRSSRSHHLGSFDLDTLLTVYGDDYKKSNWKGGAKYVFETCPNNPTHKRTFCVTQQPNSGGISARCQDTNCNGFDWPAYRELRDPSYKRRANGNHGPQTGKENADAHHRTDYGNAERMVDAHGEDLHYIAGKGLKSTGAWYAWDDTRWAQDATLEVHRRAKATVRAMWAEALAIEDADERKSALKYALSCESDTRISAMISLARSQPGISIRRLDFDRDPMLLNTPNGTLQLDADSFHEHRFGEHRREDLITRVTNASYDPDAKAPRWVQFLQEITDDDAELVRYLAQLAGLGLTGVTQDHLFIVLWGDGANGKSVFLETLAYVLGGYAKMADVSTFVATKDNRIRNDIARLHGARLVTANESEQGQRLAEALIKQLTGGDTVSARFLYEESFEFKPQAKFWLRTNNKPVLRGQDDGIWRRVRLVPFDVQILEDQQDKKLPQKLQGEASGVLNWALGGLRDYLVNGLQTPRKVSDATRQYREDQDLVQHFIDERCQVDLNATVGKTELYEAYRDWTEAEKVFTKNQPEFREEMLRRNFDEGKTGSRRFWRGLKLKRSEAQAQHGNEYTDNAPDGVL